MASPSMSENDSYNASPFAYNGNQASSRCVRTLLYVLGKREKNMELNLPAEANAFVKGLVAQGKYQNEEEAVVDGIQLLMGREKLRNEIQEGINQLDRRESWDEETVFAEVDAVIAEIEVSQQSK